jgi:hypothetical protein
MWATALESGDVDATVAIFLLHCPQLSHLTLGIDIVRENKFLPQLLAKIFL